MNDATGLHSTGDDAAAPWGLMAEFATADQLLAAARQAHAAGYRQAQAYSPFHIEGLAEALGMQRSRIPAITFTGGLLGGLGGFFMQWYSAVIDYPLNIGGRPLNSWPMFVPVTFEMVILVAALAAVGAMLIGNRLPRLRHPVFGAPDFEWASRNRFFLVLPAQDPVYEGHAAARLLDGMSPLRRIEVPAC